jgi:hypothetical protein
MDAALCLLQVIERGERRGDGYRVPATNRLYELLGELVPYHERRDAHGVTFTCFEPEADTPLDHVQIAVRRLRHVEERGRDFVVFDDEAVRQLRIAADAETTPRATPSGEWSAPMSANEVARRLWGRCTKKRGRDALAFFRGRTAVEQVHTRGWRVRLDGLDAPTREKLTATAKL